MGALALLCWLQNGANEEMRELARLRGGWSLVEVEADGEVTGLPAALNKPYLSIQDGRGYLAGTQGSRFVRYEFLCRLDQRRQPKEIDLKFQGTQTLDLKGIYKFDGNDLVVCFGGKERPTSYETKNNDGRLHCRFVRTFQ